MEFTIFTIYPYSTTIFTRESLIEITCNSNLKFKHTKKEKKKNPSQTPKRRKKNRGNWDNHSNRATLNWIFRGATNSKFTFEFSILFLTSSFESLSSSTFSILFMQSQSSMITHIIGHSKTLSWISIPNSFFSGFFPLSSLVFPTLQVTLIYCLLQKTCPFIVLLLESLFLFIR